MRQRSSRAGRTLAAGIVTISLGTVLATGCRDRKPKPLIEHAAVVRCERGIAHANTLTTLEAATSTYYQSCSDIHSEAACKAAFVAASKAPPPDQLKIIVEGCKQAYCPILGAEGFEICKPNFEATQAGMTRAWPPFHRAILERDAKALAPRINNALLSFYIKSQALTKAAEAPSAAPPAASAAPVGDGGTPPAASASGAPPLPSSSAAAPAASAGPAPSASAK